MKTLFACLIALMAAALPAQEVKKPKSEFPAEGLATFRLRVRSIPTIQVKIKPPKNGYGESNAIAYLPPERGALARAAKPAPAAPATSAAPPKMASAPWNKKG